MDILVMGIGNVLLSDEGVGVKAVEELERRYSFPEGVELLDGGTSGIELLTYIRNREVLIIIDAMHWNKPPGSVGKVENEEVPAAFRTRISPHQLGLSDLLAAAMLTNEMPGRLVLFGIQPGSLEPSFSLSKPVEQNFEKLLNGVLDELASQGCEVTPRTDRPNKKNTLWAHILHNGKPGNAGNAPS